MTLTVILLGAAGFVVALVFVIDAVRRARASGARPGEGEASVSRTQGGGGRGGSAGSEGPARRP